MIERLVHIPEVVCVMRNYSRLRSELSGFGKIWKGGYFEGDPLDPLSKSSYDKVGYISVIHATYLRCIRPYINKETVVLEIGPGRGAWTKSFLPAKEVYVIDALSAEHNNFFDYLGEVDHVKYLQVKDFSCKELPNNYFDYMFSFGTLCHVSFDVMEEYAQNLYNKMRPGANCFWMIADYENYNEIMSNLDSYGIIRKLVPQRMPLRKSLGKFLSDYFFFRNSELKHRTEDIDPSPSPGRWYNAGTEKTCEMLKKFGYEILDDNVGTCPRDPIIHFQKPFLQT